MICYAMLGELSFVDALIQSIDFGRLLDPQARWSRVWGVRGR
jgi:hypothetical protein